MVRQHQTRNPEIIAKYREIPGSRFSRALE
jgi:hypothetical protein